MIVQFLDKCVYHRGKYDEAESFADLDKLLREHEEKAGGGDGANRLFYLAIPPSVYADAAKAIRGTVCSRQSCASEPSLMTVMVMTPRVVGAEKGLTKKGWNRFVLEKPFGRDAESSAELGRKLDKVRTCACVQQRRTIRDEPYMQILI
jgi:glucose-6-phosphate 1-dehydrogenase